jgi:hypothetical protein
MECRVDLRERPARRGPPRIRSPRSPGFGTDSGDRPVNPGAHAVDRDPPTPVPLRRPNRRLSGAGGRSPARTRATRTARLARARRSAPAAAPERAGARRRWRGPAGGTGAPRARSRREVAAPLAGQLLPGRDRFRPREGRQPRGPHGPRDRPDGTGRGHGRSAGPGAKEPRRSLLERTRTARPRSVETESRGARRRRPSGRPRGLHRRPARPAEPPIHRSSGSISDFARFIGFFADRLLS